MEPVWVERDDNGAIKGVYANLQPGYAEEQLPGDDPDVAAFRATISPKRADE